MKLQMNRIRSGNNAQRGTGWTRTLRSGLLLTTLLLSLGTVSLAQSGPTRDEAFRQELLDYFSKIDRNSPTVFGKLARDPQGVASIQEAVLNLTSDELRAMRERFGGAPYWQMAPEALFGTLSPELRAAITSSESVVIGDAEELKSFRSKLTQLNALLELAPPELIDKLGIDREVLSTLGESVESATPQQLALLHRKAQSNSNWSAVSSLLDSSLNPGAREALDASIATGNMGKAKRAELERFRDEFVSFLVGLQLLPSAQREGLDQEQLYGTIRQIRDLSPEMLYLMRAKVEQDPILSELSRQLKQGLSQQDREELKALADLGPIDEKVEQGLEAFRSDVSALYSGARETGVEALFTEENWRQFQQLSPAQTALFRHRMEQVPGWRDVATLGAVFSSLRQESPEQISDAMLHTDPLELEMVRAGLVNALQTSSPHPTAAASTASASLDHLSSSQLAATKLILDRTPKGKVGEIEAFLATSFASGSQTEANATFVPGSPMQAINDCNMVAAQINWNICATINNECDVCMPDSIVGGCGLSFTAPNIPCMVTKFADIATDLGTLLSQVPQILGTVTTIAGQVPGIVNQVGSIVNQLPGIVGQISNLAGDVVSKFSNLNNVMSGFFSAVPQTVWNALSGLVNGVLANTGLPLNAQSLINFLQLNNLDNLIASLPPLPDLPCPAEGTPLASFGDVGELETLLKYQQYQFVYETLGEIIPDNEYTAALEIPIQLVSASVGYIGQCLEAAAERADNAEQGAFMEEVAGRFDSLDEYLADRFDALDAKLDTQHTALSDQLTQAEFNLSSQLASVAGDLDQAVSQTQTVLNTSITNATTVLTTTVSSGLDDQNAFLDDFQTLMVRLKIERDLLEVPKEGIGLFLLPETMGGYLETVRDIVEDTIQVWAQLGDDMKNAAKEFSKGEDDYNSGHYKLAYEHYRKAYESAVQR